jgi:predicted peptidase
MNKTRWMIGLLVLGVLGMVVLQEIKAMESKSKQQAVKMQRKVTLEMEYLLALPKDYDKDTTKAWPLMVFLHGAGERGSDINKVKVHGPAKLVEQGKDFPFLIVSPQCPEGQWWNNRVETVMALIDEIAEKYRVDPKRIYLTGLSMGGYGTWSIATTFPDRFAAIVPICGGGQPYQAGNLKKIPIWAFHGGKDPVVPVAESERMVEAVKKAGGNAKLTIYPEAQHDSWTETYNNPALYEWLLKQSK